MNSPVSHNYWTMIKQTQTVSNSIKKNHLNTTNASLLLWKTCLSIIKCFMKTRYMLVIVEKWGEKNNLLFQLIFEKSKISWVCKVMFAIIRTEWSPDVAAQHKTNKTTKSACERELILAYALCECHLSSYLSERWSRLNHSLACHDLFDWALKVVFDLLHHFINIWARKGYTLTAEHSRKDPLQPIPF